MATATAGANVGLRFDILGDNTSFKSAVAESRAAWRSATEDMKQSSGQIGPGLETSFARIGDSIAGVAQKVDDVLSGGSSAVEQRIVKGVETVKAKITGVVDAAGSYIESRVGGAAERAFGKLGADVVGIATSATRTMVGSWVDPLVNNMAKSAAESIGKAFNTETVQSWVSATGQVLSSLDQLAFGATAFESKFTTAVDGVRSSMDTLAGYAIPLGRFGAFGQDPSEIEAVVKKLDEEIERRRKNIELIGKTGAEKAKLRAIEALEGVANDQTSMAQRTYMSSKAKEYGDVAAEEDAAKAAEEQRKAFEGITANLDRQLELTKARRLEHIMTVGMVAQERAIIEAQYRMRARGREMTEEETEAVKKKAAAQKEVTDALAAESAQRQAINGIARQSENTRIEAQTLGMATGEAAAYKVELQALERFKEQNISVSEEFRQRLHAEAAAYGRNVEALAGMRTSMRLIADVGGAAMRSLEGVFDSFIEGRKVKWKDMVDSLLKDLMRLSFRAALQPIFGGGQGQGFGMIGSAIAGLFAAGAGGGIGSWETTSIPARAGGGPVSAGMPYRVGERGEELFVPNTSGHIVPNHALGQGGGTTVNIINNHAGARISSRETDDGRGNRQTHVVIEEMVATGLAGAGGQQAMRGYGARPNLASR